EKLRDGKGLQISSVMDGAGKDLQFLVQFSTHPDLTSRIESVRDFIELLEDGVRKELVPREGEEETTNKDPAELAPGDGLPFNLKVVKRLGRGGCSVTFLVERDGKESVLKVAADPKDNELLRTEAEALQKLRHHLIVELFDVYQYGDRVALHMARAGDKTLGQRLREEGKLHVDLLQRLGEDLLQAVDWLEQQGIAHRDLKPDNLGVAPLGKDKTLHLILFDFSLTRTPAEKIRAGTRPYLDPFLSLRKPQRWDTYAERFAAARTLYEMATGTLPRWGDGKSDPALLDCEATLESELFEPNLREGLTEFFAQALRRNYKERFDNAEEMLREWRRVFESLDRRTAPTEETDLENLEPALAEATLDTQLPLLPLSTRALNAAERLNLTTVRDLLNLRLFELNSLPGVGNKTRREIGRVVGILAKRFPAEALAPRPTKTPTPKDEASAEEPFSVDRMAQFLLPAHRGGRPSSEEKILKDLLGLDETAARPSEWPSQTDVAAALRITRARVGQILGKARERWGKTPAITQLRTEIAEILDKNGGVMTAAELAMAILAVRGCARSEPARSRLTVAVARAAVETERALKEPAFIVRRSGSRVLIAESQELADYAERLGKEADQLAEADPIAAPIRVVETLQKIRVPGERTLQAGRLVALAAAVSTKAAVSSRLEIYPRGLDPLRSLKLAQGALFGARELTVEEIRDRVSGRYPEAAPLPPRPNLDELLKDAGLEYEWSPSARGGEGAYQSRAKTFVQTSSGSTSLTRLTTTDTPPSEITPEIAEARRFEEKLEWAVKNGAFLTLTVPPKHLVRAEQELTRRFPVIRKSLEELVIRELKAAADRAKVSWDVVLRADGAPRESQDWRNLITLVKRSVPELEKDLATADRTLLLVHPGLLARYDRLDLLEWVRDQVTRRDGLHGAWVLVASDAQSDLPKLDGQAVPVITRGQWERIPNAWLANLHRSARPSGEAA
ncbi:MAG: BREX system serine/threonine kinase PglW, partial [Candidatus Binatia bacterium]